MPVIESTYVIESNTDVSIYRIYNVPTLLKGSSDLPQIFRFFSSAGTGKNRTFAGDRLNLSTEWYLMFKFYNLGYIYYVSKVYYQGLGNRLLCNILYVRTFIISRIVLFGFFFKMIPLQHDPIVQFQTSNFLCSVSTY